MQKKLKTAPGRSPTSSVRAGVSHFTKAKDALSRTRPAATARSPLARLEWKDLIDAHFTWDKYKLSNIRGGLMVAGPEYGALYRQAGLERLHSDASNEFVLPMTDWQPLMDARTAHGELNRMLNLIRASPRESMIAIEAIDCVQIPDDAYALVRAAREGGVSLAVQLTYNHQNQLATGCRVRIGNMSSEKGWHYDNGHGLSTLGRKVVRVLMGEGVLVDISHLNRASALEVCQIGQEMGKPVIASHSNALKVYNGRYSHPKKPRDGCAQRCLDDEEIVAIARTGGFIGVTPTPWFLDEAESRMAERTYLEQEQNDDDSKRASYEEALEWMENGRARTLELVVRHVKYIQDVIEKKSAADPWKAVALASDAEPGVAPAGYGQCARTGNGDKNYQIRPPEGESALFEDLANRLLKKGWSKKQVKALMNGNARRIFGGF